jgi:hypothetical protein
MRTEKRNSRISATKKAPAGKQRAKHQHEDNHLSDQLSRVFDAFYEQPRTMKETDIATGVMRENICWYCRTLRKENKLFPIRKRYCKVTNHRAFEYTTNPSLVPENLQLSLFQYGTTTSK